MGWWQMTQGVFARRPSRLIRWSARCRRRPAQAGMVPCVVVWLAMGLWYHVGLAGASMSSSSLLGVTDPGAVTAPKRTLYPLVNIYPRVIL